MYNNGVSKFSKELDWASIVDSIRKLKLITSIILKEHQIVLSDFHNSNVLNASNNSESLKSLVKVGHNQNDEQNLKPPSLKATPDQVTSYESKVDKIISAYINTEPDSINDYILDSIIDPNARYSELKEKDGYYN